MWAAGPIPPAESGRNRASGTIGDRRAPRRAWRTVYVYGTVTNAGTITADGGTSAYFQAGVENDGALTVSGVGTTVQTDDAVNNAGTVQVASSASLIVGRT